MVDGLSVDQTFVKNLRALVQPGTSLVLTDEPMTVSTRSGSDFSILTTEP